MTESARPEVLLWHDFVHESEEFSRLFFWRLSFSPSYDRDTIFEKLREFYSGKAITSHIAYETLGDYDLLLRTWVPKTSSPEDLELSLWQALQECRVWNISYLSCRTETHWAQRLPMPVDPKDWPEISGATINEVNAFNRGQFDNNRFAVGAPQPRTVDIQELVDSGVLLPIPLDRRGIRFFVTFDHPRLPFNIKTRKQALGMIRKTASEVLERWISKDLDVDGPQVSIYEGTGTMTDFLVMARAPHGHFHKFVRDLVLSLRSAGLDALFDMRPYTHVMADEQFSDFTEERPSNGGGGSIELDLDADESETLEFKATLSTNFRTYAITGRRETEDALLHAITRAVCGLLNSPQGGQLVIGVLEVRREVEKIKNSDAYLARLRELVGYQGEAESPEDLPNAIVGIEVEVGQGRPFADPDRYVQHLVDTLRSAISPSPMPWISVNLVEVQTKHVCVVQVRPADCWFYGRSEDGKHEEFYVREAVSTRAYSRAEEELWKRAYPRNGRSDG